MVDTAPQYNVRTEVAFTTDPEDPAPAWVDLSPRAELASGIGITRGRSSEYETVSPGRLQVTFTNKDGVLSPGNAASPLYPNILPQRRIRVTYRDPATAGTRNIVAAEDASFEGGTTGGWLDNYFGAPAACTLANSATHPSSGTKGLRMTWPTAAAGCGAGVFVTGLTVGRVYSARCVVWVSAGTPNVRFGDPFGQTSTTNSSTTGAFQTLTITWVAISNAIFLALVTLSASTAGQQCWVDAVMVDEGSSLGTFSTVSPWTDGTINYRFDGYVDEWPIEWPGGIDTFSSSTVTAADILSRIGARRKLQSVVAETIGMDDPWLYFPLSEPEGSTVVSDQSGQVGAGTLGLRQVGSGGTLTFAEGTGVGTDGHGAPTFAPASSVNGIFIEGTTQYINPLDVTAAVMVEAACLTSTAAAQTVASVADGFGSRLSVGFDATGHVVGELEIPLTGASVAATSAGTWHDGQTHDVAVSATYAGGNVTVRILIDGANAVSTTAACGWGLFDRVTIGGVPGGSLFTGTISHVAVYRSAVSDARLLEHRLSQSTGFAGERSDQRIARIASWCGIPAARLNLDVGNSTNIAHLDCTGLQPLEYMRRVEATEGGALFAARDGRLRFLNRASTYTATSPAVTVPSYMVGRNARLAQNLQQVANIVTGSREGGATLTLKDDTSINTYGEITASLSLLCGTDQEVESAVSWRLNRSKDPKVRFTSLTLDGLTDATYSTGIRTGVDIGAHTQITSMPAQAPTATLDQVAQGYTETISSTGWTFDANTSPYAVVLALIADDSGTTRADGPGVAVY